MLKGTYETLRCALLRDLRFGAVNHSSSQTHAVKQGQTEKKSNDARF
jgi:hypothetical protein